ncbi:MAG: S41 family peptidase [Bacteroidia bacterium]|nr:S41 family peptidase [Bacteroidia bacterium]
MRTWRNKIIAVTVVAVATVSFTFVDAYFEISKNMEIMHSAVKELNAYYVDEIKPGDLITKGIDGMLNSLDPYTEYYPESEVEDYKTQLTGQYGGIGSLVQKQGDYVIISEPYEGFPAQKAGLIAGDMILEVNGQSVKGKTTGDVSKLLKGVPNTPVKLLIQREGEKNPFEKNLIREEIKIKNVPYYGMLNDSVGYIKLTGFTEDAGEEVARAFTDLKTEKKMKALVFDLRGNGGGLLKEAVEIVNHFVEKGSLIVSQKAKVKEMNRTHYAEKPPLDTKMPMVVLVDKGSASASEIVSGALQDLDRAVVIGQRSFGKGLVQQTIQLVYNTQIKITTAKYYTPSGRCIQALDYFHKNPDGTADKVPDSLMKEFKTRAGRLVYDGSGIFPDLILDAKKYSPIAVSLSNKNLLFDYASLYKRNHPGISDAGTFRLSDTDYQEFIKFLEGKEYDYTTKSSKLLEDLQKSLEEEKKLEDSRAELDELKKKLVHDKKSDLIKYQDEIRLLLENEICARYYFQKGRIRSSQKNDPEIVEALKTLASYSLYSQILRGEGKYKVIGKPSVVQKTSTGSSDVKKEEKQEEKDKKEKKNKKG